MKEASYSVVIISYNGKDFLRTTLQNILASKPTPLEIIVVDDASTDGTGAMVRKDFPEVRLVTNEKNSGTSVSRNNGAKKATGEYLIFLDNDISVQPNTFGALVEFLQNHSDAGIVTARLFSEDGSQRHWNVGYHPNHFREFIGGCLVMIKKIIGNHKWLTRIITRVNLNYWDHEAVRTVDWVIEECFAIRRNLFERIHGFDEEFFMYFEGPDLCKRVEQQGCAVYFTPSAVATVHEGHAHSSLRRAKLFTASKYRFYKKHYFYLRSNPILFWLCEGPYFLTRLRKVN